MHRIAILGGGIAGLTAAYELTATAELRSKYQVSVYQMGHRLGGKLASGRGGPEARNLEHGLHVWFGFYENAFALLQGIYAEWEKDPRGPFQTWQDTIAPRRYTPIGFEDRGCWDMHPQLWPVNEQVPGAGGTELGLSAVLQQIFARLDNASWLEKGLHVVRRGLEKLDAASPVGSIVDRVRQWLPHLLVEAPGPLASQSGQAVRWFLSQLGANVQQALAERQDSSARDRANLLLADYAITILRGLLNPEYGLLEGRGIETLNEYEFTAWLLENGASKELIESTFVRLVYETLWQYEDGDPGRPNVEAGTALNWILRMFTYKGSMAWQVTAGMGDVLVAPLYQVLVKRGVEFHFFHKVTGLHLSSDRSRIAGVELGIQAQTHGRYEPLVHVDHSPVWPKEPCWEQLVEGARLRAEAVDFESKWCPEPHAATRRLEHGQDFDQVILALPLGAFKPLNDDPSPCAELIEANPSFRAMVENVSVAPTQSMQLWFDQTLEQLGFDYRKRDCAGELPAMVNGPGPFGVWADMTPVLRHEQWRGQRPLSVHYLCGMLHSDLYRRPARESDTPALARQLVQANARSWLERHAGYLWPQACLPGTWTLDWENLHAPDDARAEARLGAQFIAANVDPAICAVTTFVGSSKYRLGADESGFDNLVLAGSWTRTPLSLECVEGAVMSGRAAARVVSGWPRTFPGEGWLRTGGAPRHSRRVPSAAE